MKHTWFLIHTSARSALGLPLLAAAACVIVPTPSDTDPADPQLALEVYDARGVAMPLHALPRRPEFVLSSARALEDGAELLLFHGPPDAALLEDLARLPLRAAHDARRIDSLARAGLRLLQLTPRASLGSGQPYTLALAGSVHVRGGPALGQHGPAFVAELHSAADTGAGAAWLSTLPPAGASGVPPNLGALLLALDGDVKNADRGLWLEGSDGLALPCEVAPLACLELDSRGATCLRLQLSEALSPSARYRLRSGRELLDAHGAAIDALDAASATGPAHALRPPAFQPLACRRDELPVADGCVLLSERAMRLRVRADEPIRLLLRSGERRAARPLPNGSGSLELAGLSPDEAFELDVHAIDLAGNTRETRVGLRTFGALAPLSITEVRADPAGPEPAQEYVEILNFGPTPVGLQGTALVDATDDHPSVVEHEVELPAGARALLVADAFDPASALDPAPPPGARLIRLGPSLTRAGLANAGEALILRDAKHRRLSAVPMRPPAGRGRCVQRIDRTEPRSDAPEDFTEGPCTPGL